MYNYDPPIVDRDCEEVLLHMVAPFKAWLEEDHGVQFNLEGNNFATVLRWASSGTVLSQDEVWNFLGRFFDTEMYRQKPIEGAVEAMNRLSHEADIVILTNLKDDRKKKRTEQLAEFGIHAEVFTNQGPKGPTTGYFGQFQPSKDFHR